MDSFTKTVSNIKDEINSLEQYTSKLDQKVRCKATSVLDHDEEELLIREIRAIEQIFKETTSKVKRELEAMHKQNASLKNSTKQKGKLSLVYETQKTHCSALTKKLALILNRYRSIQVDYRNREEHRAISQFIIENPGTNSAEAKETIGNPETSQKGNLMGKSQERNQRVKQIAESIGELCMLIDELHEMVRSQEEVVDRIEVRMEESVSSTGRAVSYLKDALVYQMEAVRMKRILFVCVLVVVLIVVIYFSIKSGTAAAAPVFYY